MAVFTPVSLTELAPWLARYDVGQPTGIRGIPSGIENSNFFVTTVQGEYVLTLFEKLTATQLPYYLNLMYHLAERGIKVASPIPDREGNMQGTLCGKPASLVVKLEGGWLPEPQPAHCAQVGGMMARMHLAAQDYPAFQPNLRGLSWWRATGPLVRKFLPDDDAAFLNEELRLQETFAATPACAKLPSGPIHADLFRNNVLFENGVLSGFFDFYFAGNDTWLFDVAVAVNDWCIRLDTGTFDENRLLAFLEAYQAVRPFTQEERDSWQTLLRAAALRFWLSRLYDFHLPREAEMLTPHDPAHFERILRLRAANTAPPLPI
ncbi:MAG: homoserine kinase [Burkholderiaceae bacterium]|jgi:homoserine kinase type II|nr:homoserine kinase [Burkholderiaceae bacterium]